MPVEMKGFTQTSFDGGECFTRLEVDNRLLLNGFVRLSPADHRDVEHGGIFPGGTGGQYRQIVARPSGVATGPAAASSLRAEKTHQAEATQVSVRGGKTRLVPAPPAVRQIGFVDWFAMIIHDYSCRDTRLELADECSLFRRSSV